MLVRHKRRGCDNGAVSRNLRIKYKKKAFMSTPRGLMRCRTFSIRGRASYYRVAENVGRLGLDWFGPGESGWTSSTRFVILVA